MSLALGKGHLWLFRLACWLLRSLTKGQSGLDHEWVAAIDRGRAGHGGIKLALDLLVEPVKYRLLADGRNAIARRRHDLGGLDDLIKRLGGGAVYISRPRIRRDLRRLADFLGEIGRHTTEIARQETRERVALGVVQHF